MTEEENKQWNETNEMQAKHPNNPVVLMQAIEIRNRILTAMRDRREAKKETSHVDQT